MDNNTNGTSSNTELLADLENQFKYHMAEGSQPLQYAAVRGQCLDLAQLIVAICPDSMERDKAIERLNEVMFWANSSVARHGK